VQIAVSARHGAIKPGSHDYITRKAEKLLTYFERVTAINVTVDFGETKAKEDRVKVEILVDAEHKHNFVATDEAAEVNAAFDQALHKMEQQIKKYKEKLQDHRRDTPMGG
jgi:putative sigma-54 modulation protein